MTFIAPIGMMTARVMEEGIIVEFIDRQKILGAVVQEVKNQRLKLLTENDREVNLSSNRLSHKSRMVLDLSLGRIKTIDALKRELPFAENS